MLFKLLVFFYPIIRLVGPSLSALLSVGGLSLAGYAWFREDGLMYWLVALVCFISATFLGLLCHSYNWWLFKLRPRGCLFIPLK
ncbi:hypothetical protein [Metapseudomonas boanensis]|uniref:Uncharacterized protein n=1 Tax=Metapseudomonas boanensis TaxID=2822138 RepID=A0ABS5XKE5_9GAMM|nr:hypothetical protein [Pseudomonas boanensis]MBT8768120.1 hypothetical protein [Pseudomonas boanensis]